MSTAHTQRVFELIDAGDSAGISTLLDADPMLVHARKDDSAAEWPQHFTPLQAAAHAGSLKICRLLVEFGAEVYTNPACTYPPVVEAAWNKHQDVVDYFLKEIPEKAAGTNGLGVTINLAGRMGWFEVVKQHIERDPLSVHYRGWIGDTPLHWPAHNGYIEIVKLLLDNRADPRQHEINWIGGTPLHWASERHSDICKMLVAAGADVNARVVKAGSSFLGGTALHWCARQRDDCAEAAQALLDLGGDRSIVDSFGKTALDYAREGKHDRVAAVLAG
jgi:ankyrin repeat protein